MPVRYAVGMLALALVLLPQQARSQEGKVFRTLSNDALEGLLKRFKIEYKKQDAKLANIAIYDFKKKNLEVRLYNFQGKDLMLDALFDPMPLPKVNQWNVIAKFSRAVLNKDEKGPFTAVESNLNFAGGVTEETVREFLTTFDDELEKFSRFAASGPDAKVAVKEEKVFKEASSELVEKILDELDFKFKKAELPKGQGFSYEYTAKGATMVLTNWGKDVMVASRFKKVPLETVNKYNLDRKFIRAGVGKNSKGEFTSLEANLDCTGGISEGILRHFIAVFEGEVRDFAAFLKMKPGES